MNPLSVDACPVGAADILYEYHRIGDEDPCVMFGDAARRYFQVIIGGSTDQKGETGECDPRLLGFSRKASNQVPAVRLLLWIFPHIHQR